MFVPLIFLALLSAVFGDSCNEIQLVERIERMEERQEQMKMEIRKEVREEMEMLKHEVSTRENDLASYMRKAARDAVMDIPYVVLCAFKQVWEPETLGTAITYDKFLSNFNNADKPGGGDGQLDLSTGKKPGFCYDISFTISHERMFTFSLHSFDDHNLNVYF